MNKKKSKVLAFLLATAMLVPSANGTIYAATDLKDDKNVSIQENVQITEEDKNQNEVNYVAMIGTQKYETLQKAFDAVPYNEQVRIVIQKDIKDLKTTDIATLEAGKSIILDMNGKTITVSSEGFVGRPIINNGEMIVTGKGTITAKNSNEGGYGAIDNYGKLTIENGYYVGSVNAGGAAIKNRESGEIIIKDGTFENMTALYNGGKATVYDGSFIGRSCSTCNPKSWGYTIQNSSKKNPTIDFYNGSVIGVQGGFGVGSGTANIYDGTFRTEDCSNKHGASFRPLYIAGEEGEARCNVYGGTFEADKREAILVGNDADGGQKKNAYINVYGGTFKGGYEGNALSVDKNLGKAQILGGQFNANNGIKENVSQWIPNDGNGQPRMIQDENGLVIPNGNSSSNDFLKEHKLVEIVYKESTCTKKGNIKHYKCEKCGKLYSDKLHTNELTNVEINALGHDFTDWKIDGDYKERSCSRCNEVERVFIGNIPSKPIKPTYDHTSIIGSDRYDTAAKIADKLGSYDNVVLVNATSTMSDGLSASGLAGKENGAILLTKKDSIPKVTMDRLKKVKKVYIIGGENAISAKVANEITAAGIKVERIGGKTRVETSELVAKKLGNYKKAFVVNGFKGEADAMSASSVAAREEAPILLTNGKTSTHAKKSGVSYYVVGGNNVVNKSIASKYNAEVLAGDDRYETNREVINEFYGASETLYFANGETLVDALTASTLSKDDGLVLVGRKSDNKILNKKNTIQVGGMKFDVDFEK